MFWEWLLKLARGGTRILTTQGVPSASGRIGFCSDCYFTWECLDVNYYL